MAIRYWLGDIGYWKGAMAMAEYSMDRQRQTGVHKFRPTWDLEQ